MGIALEWMSQAEREILAVHLLPEGKADGKGAVVSLCPFHDEKTASFSYRAEKDFFKCFGCGAAGDLVKLYEHLRGMGRDSKEVFKEFRANYGPAYEAGEKRRPRPPMPQPVGWQPREALLPPDKWMERAGLFVEHSKDRLRCMPEELARLKAWGFDLADAWQCGMGWNDQGKSFPRQSWGLEPLMRRNDDGSEYPEKLYLPAGLVIPYFEGGQVIKLKIRRPEPEALQRYWIVKGSCARLSLYGEADKVLVVETERDAAMLWGRYKGAGWAFLATGGAASRPCQKIHAVLKQSRLLAVALDNDQAGFMAWDRFWRETYPQAVRWPMPLSWEVKDPGEAAERGLNLGAWLEACDLAA